MLRNFLCSECNNCTSKWDAELARHLNYFGLLFETRRQRGAVPTMQARTASGDMVEIQAGNRLAMAKPTYRVTQEGNGLIRLEINARSRSEAQKMLEGARKKYPQIDVDGILNEIEESDVYSNDPAGIEFYVQGPNVDRSIVKSAVALACEAGLTPEDCGLAMEYLKNEESEYDEEGFWHYYQKDLIRNRTTGLPLHCVFITGNPSSGLLLAYVEYYGVVRRVICLSRVYSGESIKRVYSVDPVDGQELANVEVDLDDSTLDVIVAQTADGLRAGLTKAANEIMASGMLISRCRSIAELCVACVKEHSANNEPELQGADERDVVERMVKRLIPLMRYYSTPLQFPEGFDPTKVSPDQ